MKASLNDIPKINNVQDIKRLTQESNETIKHDSSDLALNLTDLALNFTDLDLNSSEYAAQNVSNDHDFTKLFTPSAAPSDKPTAAPTAKPSHSPSLASSSQPSSAPSSAPTFTIVESCPDFVVETNPAETEDVVTLGGSGELVTFFYEIVTSVENTDIEETIAAVETRILQDTAASFLSCAGRRRLQGNDGNIARIESDPPDVVDDGNECSTETGIAVADDMKCIPIIGGMTFYSDCDGCKLPTKDILKNIRASMEDGVYTDGSIVEQVSFTNAGNIKLDSQPGMAVGSAFGVIGALGLLAFAAVYKRKNRSKRHLDLMDVEDEIAAEEEQEAKGSAFDLRNINQAVKLNEWRTVQEEDGAINVAPPSEFHSNW